MSFIHEASQIEASFHSPALLELLQTKVSSRTLIGTYTSCLILQEILISQHRVLGRMRLRDR